MGGLGDWEIGWGKVSGLDGVCGLWRIEWIYGNKMKTGTKLTENPDLQLSAIKNRYTNNFSAINSETMLSDLLTVINILESQSNIQKDPRVTIELAKLRKENQSLKKELSKFFPDKDSIETTSKKIEHLFKIDTPTLIRYENSDLKERNEKLLSELNKYKEKNEEFTTKLKEEQTNYQKLKDISADLRMENTNLIIKNRELNKKLKILQENTEKTENLQERLRNALNGKIKPTSHTLKDSSIQTLQNLSIVSQSHSSISLISSKRQSQTIEISKLFQISLKPQQKKLKILSIQNPSKVFCLAIKPKPKAPESISSPQTLQAWPKAKLHLESQISLICKPQPPKPRFTEPKVLESPDPRGLKAKTLETTLTLNISCKPNQTAKPKAKKRLQILPLISISIPGLKPSSPCPAGQSHGLVPRSLALSQCASIKIKAKKKSKDHHLPAVKASLSLSQTSSSSFPNKRIRTLLISKPSSSSITATQKPSSKLSPSSKHASLSHQYTFSITPDLKSLSLYTRSIYNRAESEEFEVFNAATVYKPDLTLSTASLLSILPPAKTLSSETWSIGCKKKSTRLKLSSFSILKLSSSKPSMQSFKIFIHKAKIDFQTLRRLSYVPESKATDDEETKSNAGGRARRNRAPPRKPAIEEYFNLVSFTQTFQAVKMNFVERDKVGALNCDELQARALQSGIQFNMYHDWVKEQFVITANVAAKRPSVMVKK